ncbi:MAG: magnesium chelatase [Flexibacter sp. CG_4_10_14_3_um_filter_32_15]|nr:MAG: magnesium chelatase [Flexibacter sp. CG_4_10_14_3_um_filter_32_15]
MQDNTLDNSSENQFQNTGFQSEETQSSNQETTQESSFTSSSTAQLDFIYQSVSRVKSEIHKVIIGQDKMIDLLLVSLFADGHVLLEGVPGVAKTITAKLLARTLSIDFSRIQFTPDMMPTDILGTTIYSLQEAEFNFTPGPVFSQIVLIDEINRAPAKTQAALFEVMEERQVTVDGTTHKMKAPFFVIATQNPIEQEGTYRLPEAQLDRFLFRIQLDYPSLSEEKQILYRFKNQLQNDISVVNSVLKGEDILACRKIVSEVHIKDELLDYIAEITYQTRNHGSLYLGASPRASLAIMRASKAMAVLRGRMFVTPEDIQEVAYPVLGHRIMITPEREMEGLTGEDLVKEMIQKLEVPR